MYFSIRTKFLVVISVLLVSALFAYLFLADRIFREDKLLLVYDTSRTKAEGLTSEFEGKIKRTIDKVELMAKLATSTQVQVSRKLIREYFFDDPEIIFFELLKLKNGKQISVFKIIDENNLRELKIQSWDPIQLQVEKNSLTPESGVRIFNVSDSGIPLFQLKIPAKAKNDDAWVVNAVVNARSWIKPFEVKGTSLNFAVNRDGSFLAHSDREAVLKKERLVSEGFSRFSEQGAAKSQQTEVNIDGRVFIGNFCKTEVSSTIIGSLIEKENALAATKLLLEKTILLSLVIITIVFLISLWFAGSLTNPLLDLVRATHQIAQGHFDAGINVKSKDEIGVLATAFEKMAHDLKTSRLELEDKVQERTQELENKNVAIRNQQEVLLRTTRLAALGEIAGQAAHEVLNPLTGMIARIETMKARLGKTLSSGHGAIAPFHAIVGDWKSDFKKIGFEGWVKELRQPSKVNPAMTLVEEDLQNLGAFSEQLKLMAQDLERDYQHLLNESFRISRILENMRSLSRASRFKKTIDLCQLVRECVHADEDLLQRYGISIETDVPEKVKIELDNDEMKQVFSNLIKNSRDAIQEKRSRTTVGDHDERGLIRITVSEDSNQVIIRFWDNGIGVDPVVRDKIFDINFSTKGAEGTGYGLSICRRLVRQAGGELNLRESDFGAYAEFEIVLPKEKAKTGEVVNG